MLFQLNKQHKKQLRNGEYNFQANCVFWIIRQEIAFASLHWNSEYSKRYPLLTPHIHFLLLVRILSVRSDIFIVSLYSCNNILLTTCWIRSIFCVIVRKAESTGLQHFVISFVIIEALVSLSSSFQKLHSTNSFSFYHVSFCYYEYALRNQKLL